MEVAIYALGIMAGILLTSAFFFLGVDRWYNARLGLLLLFFGIILSGGTICLKWFQEVLKSEAAAASQPSPSPPPPSVVGNLVLNKPLAANEVVEVTLTLLNGGGETAGNLSGEVGFVYKYDTDKPDPKLCATRTTFGPVNLLARAQVPILVRGLTPLPADELAAIEESKEWVFFCGKGSYEGASGRVPLDFCWVYRREVKAFTDCSDLNNPHNQPTADRAWLSLSVVPAGPLVFSEDTATLPVRFVITNTGRSPANGVIVKADVITSPPEELRTAGLKRQQELCGERGGRIDQITVFPDRTEHVETNFLLSVQKFRDQFATGDAKKWGGLEGRIAAPILVGCVDYLVGGTPHQTGFIYQAHTIGPNGQAVSIFIGQNVPTERLMFVKSPFGGDYAN